MADEQFYTILTNKGKAKIANATLLNSNVTLTTLKVGDGNGAYYNPTEEQTDLKNVVHTCQVGSISIDKKNPNWVVVETIIPGSVGGFIIREIGLFDTEGDMIAVGKYPETYKPVVANGASKDLNVRTIFEVSNAENVTLNINPSVIIATKEDINNLQEQITDNATQLNAITKINDEKALFGKYTTTNNISIASSNNTTVLSLDTVTTANDNFSLNTSTGVVTINNDGLYYIDCVVTFDINNSGHREVSIVTSKNNNRDTRTAIDSTTLGMRISLSLCVYLNKNDIARIQIGQGSGSALNVTGILTIRKIG